MLDALSWDTVRSSPLLLLLRVRRQSSSEAAAAAAAAAEAATLREADGTLERMELATRLAVAMTEF